MNCFNRKNFVAKVTKMYSYIKCIVYKVFRKKTNVLESCLKQYFVLVF